jgi:hypothetical protein
MARLRGVRIRFTFLRTFEMRVQIAATILAGLASGPEGHGIQRGDSGAIELAVKTALSLADALIAAAEPTALDPPAAEQVEPVEPVANVPPAKKKP